jgi:hypothetical protein
MAGKGAEEDSGLGAVCGCGSVPTVLAQGTVSVAAPSTSCTPPSLDLRYHAASLGPTYSPGPPSAPLSFGPSLLRPLSPSAPLSFGPSLLRPLSPSAPPSGPESTAYPEGGGQGMRLDVLRNVVQLHNPRSV